LQADTYLWDTTGDGVPDAYDADGDGAEDALPHTARVAPVARGNSGGDSSGSSSDTGSGSSGTSTADSSGRSGSSGHGSRGYWSEVAEQLLEADYGAFGRGLGLAADHVNILGNNALVLDVLRIAVGAAHQADCAPLDARAGKAAAKAAAKAGKAGPQEPDVAAAAAAAAAAACHANFVGDRVESDVLRQAASVHI
jgi:hypothetical protein